MWQFLCDSIYDWIHRYDKFGQGDYETWWLVREVKMIKHIHKGANP